MMIIYLYLWKLLEYRSDGFICGLIYGTKSLLWGTIGFRGLSIRFGGYEIIYLKVQGNTCLTKL